LRLGESVIVPMLIALLLATVLGPAASWLHEKLKMPWSVACITVIVGLILANGLIIAVFSSSVVRLVNQLSDQDKMVRQYKEFRLKLEKYVPPGYELDPELLPENPDRIVDIGVFRYITESAPVILRQAASATKDWTWELVVILFITFFVLLEGRMLARRAAAIFGPSPEVQAKVTEVLLEMAVQVRNYLVWRTIINFVLAVVMWAIYQVAGLQQGLTWAILLFILNYIPYFGPVLASVPPFFDALIFSDQPVAAILVTVAFWVVIVLEGYLVVPMLMGRNMDLNATTVMLACLFWELVWPGMTGLFLAMPIMAGIKAILYNVPEWQPWALLMSSADHREPEDPPEGLAPTPAKLPDDSPNGHAGKEVAKKATPERA
jgi:predicted PurR-regulated permease PerM